ncbi:MAG: bacteriohemerythrin [Pseudomonadota bacterium]
MKIIKWNDALELGIPRIDDDHRRWVEMFNALFSACLAGVGPDVLAGTLQQLLDYTKGHFQREEAFLEEIGFDGLEEHRKIHAAMVAEVQKIEEQLRKGATHDLSAEVLSFLHDWLIDHITETDVKYAVMGRAGANA